MYVPVCHACSYQGWDCKLAHGLGNPYPVLWHTLASTYLQNILLKDVVAGLYDEWKKPDEVSYAPRVLPVASPVVLPCS